MGVQKSWGASQMNNKRRLDEENFDPCHYGLALALSQD